ncbi:hypothetical protein [Paenibacillus oceani]|uniref:Uncharacterized protein n=1 Tax=Paenibacillus oceani TaxID=2772510 RepID=A0A927C8X6_9BACL|nr:hypothetical protein [Paenibacillus oceani]MBD2863563.1 hypothetical protein [Paenibacillus oceani]
MSSRKPKIKVLPKQQPSTRGTCPNCSSTGVKLVHELTRDDGTVWQVCKLCRNKKKLKKYERKSEAASE